MQHTGLDQTGDAARERLRRHAYIGGKIMDWRWNVDCQYGGGCTCGQEETKSSRDPCNRASLRLIAKAAKCLPQSFAQCPKQHHSHLVICLYGLTQSRSGHHARINIVHGDGRRGIGPPVDERQEAKQITCSEDIKQHGGAVRQNSYSLDATAIQEHQPTGHLPLGPQDLVCAIVTRLQVGCQDTDGFLLLCLRFEVIAIYDFLVLQM